MQVGAKAAVTSTGTARQHRRKQYRLAKHWWHVMRCLVQVMSLHYTHVRCMSSLCASQAAVTYPPHGYPCVEKDTEHAAIHLELLPVILLVCYQHIIGII